MPNHKSAVKRVRQNEKKNLVNRARRSSVRTEIKKLRAAIKSGDKSQCEALLTPTISVIDNAVNKGILHKNAAARHKSRLSGHVNSMS